MFVCGGLGLAWGRWYCRLGGSLQFRVVYVGYCRHPATVYIRGPIMGYIEPYCKYYPTVTEGWQY